MTDIYNNSRDKNNGKIEERRASERRLKKRRGSNRNEHYDGPERRLKSTDRRVTIVNRLHKVVTDRRSLD